MINRFLILLLVIGSTAFAQQKKPSPKKEAAKENKKIMNNDFAIVMHGGAGIILKENMTPELEKEYRHQIELCLQAGYDTLARGGSSLDAVEMAIKILEDSPLFNAGRGSVFTSDGKNEMDASIMNGETLDAGAVAAVHTIRNPISAARCVMEHSEHILLVGDGAEKFVRKCNVKFEDPKYFFEQKRWDQLQKIKETDQTELDHGSNIIPGVEDKDKKYGTVGVVALDKYGNLAAGTSTGGMTNKKYGRVGDSPIIGAGTYANNKTCGVSCTGHGEYFIREVVAYDVSALMEYKGMKVQDAADEVVMKKLVKLGGEGGLVAMDAKGNIAMSFNTPGMYRGYMKSSGEKEVMIYK
jgi:beta-aspartyl-peptidase (threonine type)